MELLIVFIALVVILVCFAPHNVAAPTGDEPLWKNLWNGQPIDCAKTNWMHTAKTSSTFCMALQHVCCPAQFQKLTTGVTTQMLEYAFATHLNRSLSMFSFDSHYCYQFKRKGYEPMNCSFAGWPEHIPLHPTIVLKEKMGMVVVREPKARIISSFLDGIHLEGFVNHSAAYHMRLGLREMSRDKSIPREVWLLRQAQTYVNHHDLHGHQVKMLLGGFNVDFSIRNETAMQLMVGKAVERLREFYFVGIFEEYARSLRLFHGLSGKDTTPTDVELFPRRSTSATDKAFLMRNIQFEDPYDTLLYQSALQIFQEELAFVKKTKNLDI